MTTNQQSGAGGTVKEEVQRGAQQVSQGAQQAADQAGNMAKSMVRDRRQSVAQDLTDVAHALRDSGNKLQKKGDGTAAQAVDMAATRVDDLAKYVQNTTIDEMVNGVQNFARREPALFFGGAFALGFALTRFFKSSPPAANPARAPYSGGNPNAGGYANQYGSGPAAPSAVPGNAGGYTAGRAPAAGAAMPGNEGVTAVEEYVPGKTEVNDGTAEQPRY